MATFFLKESLLAEIVDHHRMVDDEIDFGERIDLFGIAAQRLHRIAHRGQIDHGGHAGQILHQHARGAERDFAVGGLGLEPGRHRLDVVGGDGLAVFVAQQVFQQHLQRIGQSGNALQAVLLGGGEAEIGIGLAARVIVRRDLKLSRLRVTGVPFVWEDGWAWFSQIPAQSAKGETAMATMCSSNATVR